MTNINKKSSTRNEKLNWRRICMNILGISAKFLEQAMEGRRAGNTGTKQVDITWVMLVLPLWNKTPFWIPLELYYMIRVSLDVDSLALSRNYRVSEDYVLVY